MSVAIVEVEHDVRHTFRIKVTGAPDMAVSWSSKGRSFRPDLIVFTYDSGDYANVKVSGLRVLSGGRIGKEWCTNHFYRLNSADMPEWVREVCTQRLMSANLIARPDA